MKKELDALRIERGKKRSAAPQSRFWIVLSLALFLSLVLLSVYAYRLSTGKREALDSKTEIAESDEPDAPLDSRAGREVLIASGYVVAHHKHELGSKVMGKVQWIGVEKGDYVRKGQLLVKLEDREYRAQLAQAEAARRLARARLAELEAGTRPEEIARGAAELERRKADLENAREELARMQSLYQDGAVAEQQADDARARFEMAEAAVKASLKDYELLKLGPRAERLEQARAEVAQAAATVDYAQTMLDATEIRAPVSGTILRRIAEIGEMITTSFAGEGGAKSAVLALADLSDLQVELDISQTDFNQISRDQECEMTPEAFPDRVYRCAIDEISPEADRQKASIQVKVKVLEPDEFLRPEMSARVTFLEKEYTSNE